MTETTSAIEQVLAGLADLGWQEEVYRDLHAHPELPHEEHRTAALVAERLRTHAYDVHEQVGGTGVVGVLRNGDGPTVLLRADMDALPVLEETGLPYASAVVSEEHGPVMHACGPGRSRSGAVLVGRTRSAGARPQVIRLQERFSDVVVVLRD